MRDDRGVKREELALNKGPRHGIQQVEAKWLTVRRCVSAARLAGENVMNGKVAYSGRRFAQRSICRPSTEPRYP